MDFEKSEALYQVLKSCKEGDCGTCTRNPNSSNTYWCRKQLLQDCFDWFEEYLDIE